jgi:hypothetical protein
VPVYPRGNISAPLLGEPPVDPRGHCGQPLPLAVCQVVPAHCLAKAFAEQQQIAVREAELLQRRLWPFGVVTRGTGAAAVWAASAWCLRLIAAWRCCGFPYRPSPCPRGRAMSDLCCRKRLVCLYITTSRVLAEWSKGQCAKKGQAVMLLDDIITLLGDEGASLTEALLKLRFCYIRSAKKTWRSGLITSLLAVGRHE